MIVFVVVEASSESAIAALGGGTCFPSTVMIVVVVAWTLQSTFWAYRGFLIGDTVSIGDGTR